MGSLATARRLHTTTLLPNGKVLVAGGYNSSQITASCELFTIPSPSDANTWSSTGSLPTARGQHTATLLPNGKVLITGGIGSIGNNHLSSAVLYDPTAGTWSSTGSMSTARAYHTATLLPNGKVLVAGGDSGSSYLSSAELYDPTAGTWSSTGSMSTARVYHAATLLPNGKVLVEGGTRDGSNYLSSAELYIIY